MLTEAVEVMRRLWTGETVDFHGDVYTVENARLFDAPDAPIPVIVSGFGEAATELAGAIGDGFWGHGTDPDQVERYIKAGGDGPRYAQIDVCVGPDEDECRRIVHDVWPNGAIPGTARPGSADLDPFRAGKRTRLGARRRVGGHARIRSRCVRRRREGVRRRRLRPRLLPPDRTRSGRLVRDVDRRAGRRARSVVTRRPKPTSPSARVGTRGLDAIHPFGCRSGRGRRHIFMSSCRGSDVSRLGERRGGWKWLLSLEVVLHGRSRQRHGRAFVGGAGRARLENMT